MGKKLKYSIGLVIFAVIYFYPGIRLMLHSTEISPVKIDGDIGVVLELTSRWFPEGMLLPKEFMGNTSVFMGNTVTFIKYNYFFPWSTKHFMIVSKTSAAGSVETLGVDNIGRSEWGDLYESVEGNSNIVTTYIPNYSLSIFSNVANIQSEIVDITRDR